MQPHRLSAAERLHLTWFPASPVLRHVAASQPSLASKMSPDPSSKRQIKPELQEMKVVGRVRVFLSHMKFWRGTVAFLSRPRHVAGYIVSLVLLVGSLGGIGVRYFS